jgi:hypothetical protein
MQLKGSAEHRRIAAERVVGVVVVVRVRDEHGVGFERGGEVVAEPAVGVVGVDGDAYAGGRLDDEAGVRDVFDGCRFFRGSRLRQNDKQREQEPEKGRLHPTILTERAAAIEI